ncbi:MAG: DUF4242 domain-containing protein [Rubrobacteraceae bacterium]
MPRYMLERVVGELSEEQMKAAFAKEQEVQQQMPDVRWVRSYYSAEEGKLYCEYEAAKLQSVLQLNRSVGVPVDRATVVRKLEPSMFR